MDKPTDEQILAAVTKWGSGTITCGVRGVLEMDGFKIETPWVLRTLKRLEREGKVERTPTSYAVMLCWKPVTQESRP